VKREQSIKRGDIDHRERLGEKSTITIFFGSLNGVVCLVWKEEVRKRKESNDQEFGGGRSFFHNQRKAEGALHQGKREGDNWEVNEDLSPVKTGRPMKVDKKKLSA